MHRTYLWVDFLGEGESTLDGQPLPVGAVVRAHDPTSVLAGRIIEVTPDREVVWDYCSPFLGQGPHNQGRHVYRATRYTDEQVEPLFEARQDEPIVGVSSPNQTPIRTWREALRFYREGLGG